MKFLPYIVRNMLRNKLRNLFTTASMAVSLFLVTLLYAFLAVQDELAAESVQYNRVIVTSTSGLTFPLPLAYLDDTRKLDDARYVTPMNWFGGRYKAENIPFAQFATDPQTVFLVYDEYTLSTAELAAFQADRTACVAGRKLARNKSWKIGDRIAIKGDIYNCNLELTLVGIVDGPENGAHLMSLFFNWDYLDQGIRATGDERSAGRVGLLSIKAASASAIPDLMQTIDERFASSNAPAQAMTEQAFQQSFTEMIGNVQAFIRNTALAVVIALICVAGNAMAMSMRERTREVAVLKAIGFQRGTVLSLILSEAIGVAMMGGVLGVLSAKLIFSFFDSSRLGIPMLEFFYIPWTTVILGLSLAAVIGLASGIIPAWRAAQISVVDGLRRVV